MLTLAVAAALAGAAVPVQANHPACPTTYDALCLYDTDPSHRRYVINEYPPGFCFNIPADWDNDAEGFENNTDHYVTFYTDNGCATDGLVPTHIAPNGAYRRFDPFDEDEANSVRFQN